MSAQEKETTKKDILGLAKECQVKSELLPSLVERCRALSVLEYEQQRKSIATAAGFSRVSALDECVQRSKTDSDPDATRLKTVEPCAGHVNPAELLNDIVEFLRRFVFAPRHILDAAALHVVFGHTLDAFSIAPRLFITSPERECGKSLLLEIIAALSQRPLVASAVSDALLPRVIEKYRPTVFLDEIDTYRLNDREGLSGILNSGQRRAAAFAWKTSGENHEPKSFSTWAAYVFAGIAGKMPDTTRSRCIILPLGRKPSTMRLERFGRKQEGEAAVLASRIARYAVNYFSTLETIDQRDDDADLPLLGSDRSLDNWRPLLAIAETAGPEWKHRACNAARELSGAVPEPEAAGAMLLADLHDVFFNLGGMGSEPRDPADVPQALFSEEIVERLTKGKAFAERPWADLRNGKPLTTYTLAALLRPYDIRSGNVWVRGIQGKGYKLEQLKPVFNQYCSHDTALEGTAVRNCKNVEPEQYGTERQDGQEPSCRPADQDGRTSPKRPPQRKRTATARYSGSPDGEPTLLGDTSDGSLPTATNVARNA